MQHRTGLARQYDQLTARERLQMLLEAQARGDQAEVRRLWDSCPKKAYRQMDVAFEGPYEAAKKIALLFSIDIAYQFGNIQAFGTARRAMPSLLLLAVSEAEHKHDDEEDEPEEPVDVYPHEQEDREGDEDDDAADDRDERERRRQETEECCAGYLPDTWGRADELLGRLAQTRRVRACNMLLGMDRFTRRVLGLEAMTMLRAWQPPIAKWVVELDVDTAEPEEAWVKQHDEDAQAVWNKLLGP